MILSSASDAHGRRTSSSKILPRPRRWRFAMKVGNRSHRCSDDSSSSALSRQLSVSDIPVICCQRRRWDGVRSGIGWGLFGRLFWGGPLLLLGVGSCIIQSSEDGWATTAFLLGGWVQRGSTNPRGRWVELLQSRVSLLNQLARCREVCSARAPTGFELLSSCRARRLLTVFGARRHRVGYDLVIGEDHLVGPICQRYDWQTGRWGLIAFGSSPRKWKTRNPNPYCLAEVAPCGKDFRR